MRRVVSLLLGPEGLWIAISLVVSLVAASNEPSTPAGNDFLETLWVAIPLAGIPLTFLTAYLPGGGGWRWLLRTVVISSVGVLVASFIAASGVDYHDSRNSGLLGAPAYSLSIGILLLLPLTTLAAALVWKKNRIRTR
jgi:CDP-diglyceride synthetase